MLVYHAGSVTKALLELFPDIGLDKASLQTAFSMFLFLYINYFVLFYVILFIYLFILSIFNFDLLC